MPARLLLDQPWINGLLLSLSVLLPGALIWTRILAPRWKAAGLRASLSEALLTAVLAGLGLTSLLALLLTLWHLAFPLPLAIASLAASALLYLTTRSSPPDGMLPAWPRPQASDRWTLAPLLLALVLFLPPTDSYLLGSDASVYLGAAAVLQREGAPELVEPWIAELPPEVRAALFRSGDRFSPFHRFPGGMILRDPARGRSVPSFPTLFPLWAGLLLQALPPPGVLYLSPALAALALLVLFLMARDLLGAPWALGAATVLALAPVQVTFARTAMPEVQLQLLLLAAAWWAARAARGLGLPYRILAAAFLVLALFSKYHAHLALLAVALIALAELAGGVRLSLWVPTYGALALLYAFYLIHHQRFPTDYPAHFEAWYSAGGAAVVLAACAAAILAVPAALFLRRRPGMLQALTGGPRLRRCAAAALVAAAGYNLLVRPFHPFGPADFDQVNLIKVGWQVSYLGLLLAISGLAWMLARSDRSLLLFLLIGLAFAVAFVAQGDSIPYQFWHARKLVPAVLPMAAIGIALGARQIGSWARRRSAALRPLGALLLLAVALLQLRSDRILLGHHEGAGAYFEARAIAAKLPQPGLTLFAPARSLRGLHLASFAGLIEGRPAVSLPAPAPPPRLLQRLERWLRRRGWALVVVAPPGRVQWLPAGRLDATPYARAQFRLPLLEKPVGRLPRMVRSDAVNLVLYRVGPKDFSPHDRPAQRADQTPNRGQSQGLP